MLSVGKDEIGYVQLYIPTDEACSGEKPTKSTIVFWCLVLHTSHFVRVEGQVVYKTDFKIWAGRWNPVLIFLLYVPFKIHQSIKD